MAVGRVTVFGGTGFIGRALAARLAADGTRVRVAARRPEAARTGPNVEAVKADILDDAPVRAAVAGADAAINLVGILSESGRHTFEAVHVAGAGRVAAAARDAGAATLIHVSALGAGRLAPAAADRTKAAGEVVVRRAFPGAVVVRPGLVFGPGDHFFTGFAAMARRLPALPLIGGGETRFQPVHVGDAVEGFVALLADADAAGATYGFGGPRVYSFRALLELLFDLTGRRRPLVSLPFIVAEPLGAILQILPGPPLTRDQVRLLRTDKVVGPDEATLADLGVAPVALEDALPGCLP